MHSVHYETDEKIQTKKKHNVEMEIAAHCSSEGFKVVKSLYSVP